MPSRTIHFLFLLFVVLGALGGIVSQAQDSAQKSDDVVYELHNAGDYGIKSPKAIYAPDPEYTDKTRRKKINGAVVVSLIVTPEGTVRDPKIVTSLDKDLDQQALAALSKWKFEPATKDGKPVTVRISTEVSFRIH
jgi:TonB family protein